VTEQPPDLDLADLNETLARDVLRLDETPTDTGNARRFVRLVGDRVRWVPAYDAWVVWDGRRLARDDGTQALRLTQEVCADVRRHATTVPDDERRGWEQWANITESASRRNATLTLAAPELVAQVGDLDARDALLNTPTGTLDLEHLKLLPHAVEDRCTRLTGVGYDPDARWSEPLRDYVRTFVPEEGHWKYLMRALGSCLRGGNAFRIWLIVHGPTSAGKTQLLETIADVLGDYAVPVPTSVFRGNLDDRPRPDLLQALGARFVYADEGSRRWELHADHIRHMTGRGRLVVRGMRSNVMVAQEPSFTPLTAGNELPRIKDADQALRRRIVALHFPHSVVGREDVTRGDYFRRDPLTRAALLTQLAEGCRDAYLYGLGDMPQAWALSTWEAFGRLNHVGEFLQHMRDTEQLVEVDPGTVAASSCWKATELYATYAAWVGLYGDADDRRGRLSLTTLGAALRDVGWESKLSNGTRWLGKLQSSAQTHV